MPPSQKNRSIAITTPLGADALVLTSFVGLEQLGRLFEYEVELLGESHEIAFDDIVGASVTVRLETAHGGTRYFNGIVNRFVQRPALTRYGAYRATIVPWFWLLTRTSDCRIWSGSDKTRTVPEIIEEVFRLHSFDAFENKLTGTYSAWDYCVQYRETDFNFVSRLMEQEGIYYYFKHEDGKHTLVLADSADGLAEFSGYEEIHYRNPADGTSDPEHIRDWSLNKQLLTGSFIHNDFDFESPKKDLKTEPQAIARAHDNAKFEIYDYPGEYTDPGDGKTLAEVRIQELQAGHFLLRGQGDTRGICAGHTFTLKDLPRDDQNQKYLVVSVNHSMQSKAFESDRGGSSEGESYLCSFSVMPASEVFRPTRTTPKPLIQGPQTAIVVGPSGEEIHTDKYGRVKVKFHWDRYSKADDKSSCWIRVSQTWAGMKWGAIHIPRIGQEVIVEFLEGDPDWPIITGRVYNGDQPVPYDLPDNKTQSGIKSRSSKEGSGENFNEIRFEDKKGSEELYIHAEKDKKVIVENDRSEEVGHDESISIGNDRTEDVGNNETITIGKDRTESVGKNESISIGESRTEDVGKEESITIGGGRTESVGKDESITIGGNRTEDVAKKEQVTIGDERTVSVSKNDGLSVGKKLVVDAGDEISFTSGSASITMKKDGTISIKGKDITIEGSGKINVKASSDVVIKGSKVLAN